MPRSALVDDHRQQRAGGGVGEDLGHPEQEHRDEHHRDADDAGQHRWRRAPPDQGTGGVDGDHEQPCGRAGRPAPRRAARRAARAAAGAARRGRPGTARASGRRSAAGPAASARPSPMFVIQDEASNHRKFRPMPGGRDGFEDPIHKMCTLLPHPGSRHPRRRRGSGASRRGSRRTPSASARAAPTTPTGSIEESESGESLPRTTPGVGVAPMPSPGTSTT